VIAAGWAGIPARRALPALTLGSSVFLQLHLVLGLLLGSVADHAFQHAKGPAVIVVAVVVGVAFAHWFARRRREGGAASVREAAQACAEAACPACLALNALVDTAMRRTARPLALAAGDDPA